MDIARIYGSPVSTRTQLLSDGHLIDVTSQARQHGFRVPIAITLSVYKRCVEWHSDKHSLIEEKETNRLSTLLATAAMCIKHSSKQCVYFGYQRVPCGSSSPIPKPISLVCQIDSDDGGRCSEITISFPEEVVS